MPQTKDGQKYRVRYGGYSYRDAWSKINPRNTMVTIEKGTGKDRYIYFGIARCKLSTDRFQKKLGRELALVRAEEAIKENVQVGFYLSKDGTKGSCKIQYVRSLLKHFESLDVKE